MKRWADQIRVEIGDLPPPSSGWKVRRSETVEELTGVLVKHWPWASQQPWFGRMEADLLELLEQIEQARLMAPIRVCPVCGIPVRVDRYIAEHRACIW